MTGRSGWVRETVVQYRGEPSRSRRIGSSVDVVALLREASVCQAEDATESFVVIAVDARNRTIGWTLAGRGGVTGCPVEPGSVFRPALIQGAVGVVLAHNHPSGDPTPSAEDVALTERLVRAGDLLGVRVLDHVIVGRDGSFSFLDAGILRPKGAPRID